MVQQQSKESIFILDTNVIIDLKCFGLLNFLREIENVFATDLIINKELKDDEKEFIQELNLNHKQISEILTIDLSGKRICDVSCVVAAKYNNGIVVSRDNGVIKDCKNLKISSCNTVDFIKYLFNLGIISKDDISKIQNIDRFKGKIKTEFLDFLETHNFENNMQLK